MKSLVLILTSLISFSGFAQKTGCNCKFQSINSTGIAEGGQGTGFQFQTVNGISIRKWFIGMGAGFDYYRFRSIPVFAELRKEFLNNNINPFLYGAAGIHFPWRRDQEMHYYNGDISAGLYYDVGIGFHFSSKKTNGFTISTGYSFKRLTETVYTFPYCLVGPCPRYEQSREYGLKRISMKVGWRFRTM